VAEPVLDGTNGNSRFMPARGATLAETMQIEMFANGSIFAGNLGFFLFSYLPSVITVRHCPQFSPARLAMR
jgi:hypothetical protein